MGAGDVRYWVRSGTAVQGPFEAERIREWIASGRVRAEMQFSTDGVTYVPGSETRGLFAEPPAAPRAPAAAEPPAPDRPRRARHGGGGGGAASGERPPPGISVFCRLVAALVLTAAWVVGQWAQASFDLGELERGAEVRIVYGLHGVEGIIGKGTAWKSLFKSDFTLDSDVEGTEVTFALGWAITVLLALAILGCAASAAVVWGLRRLPAVNLGTLLASLLIAALGVTYITTGLVANASGVLGERLQATRIQSPTSIFPGVSFWLAAGAFVFVAVASLFDRLAAREAMRLRQVSGRAFS